MKRRIVWGLSVGLALILVIAGCRFLGNLDPIASFIVNYSHGVSPLTVTFDATGSSDPDGAIVEFYWDFGDGQTASLTLKTTTHVYTNVQSDSKVFTAILTVIDNLGAEDSACKNITVDPSP
jgi:PKD repeat protein